MPPTDREDDCDNISFEEHQALCEKAASRLRTKLEAGLVYLAIFGPYAWLAYLVSPYVYVEGTPLTLRLLFALAFLGGIWLLVPVAFRIFAAVFRKAVQREIDGRAT